MGDVTISEQLLRDLIDKLGESAAAGIATANAVTLSTAASEKRQEAIIELLTQQASTNAALALDVKRHVTVDIDTREKWWRKGATLFATALILATLLGIPIGRIISAALHIPIGH